MRHVLCPAPHHTRLLELKLGDDVLQEAAFLTRSFQQRKVPGGPHQLEGYGREASARPDVDDGA